MTLPPQIKTTLGTSDDSMTDAPSAETHARDPLATSGDSASLSERKEPREVAVRTKAHILADTARTNDFQTDANPQTVDTPRRTVTDSMTETPSTGAPAADRVDRLDTPSSVPGSSIQEPAEVVAAATISSGPDRSSVTDLRSHAIILAAQISDRVASDRLALHGDKALQAFDSLTDLVAAENTDIQDMLRETREELVDAYIASMMSRAKVACIMLRGVMEGLFTALFYRQQTISLNLWASNKQFVLVHQMFEPNHDFR
jgi:hypothetical protein